MNRKNTIIIAVMINAGLVAVLALAGLTTTEQAASQVASQEPPRFDAHPLFEEQVTLAEAVRAPVLEIPVTEPIEPLVHKLPELTAIEKEPIALPVAAHNEVTVKKGDTLEKIAKAHRTTTSELAKINQLPSSFLKVGQVLKLPAEKVGKMVAAAPALETRLMVKAGPEYYTMKVGENPWAIAVKHKMKVDELLKLNGLNEEKARKLKPGDRLRIR